MKISRFLAVLSERIAIPNLTLILLVGSALAFLGYYLNPSILNQIVLIPDLVKAGEFWRIVSFLFYPLSLHPIFAAFTYYLFYLMGTSLEAEWGEAKFTQYILLSWISTIALSFIFPGSMTTNTYIYTSVFLAFAYLNPEFPLALFFIIPVPIKYLAAITWIFFAWTILTAPVAIKVAAIIPLINFFLFFGRAIFGNMLERQGDMTYNFKRLQERATAFHRCESCGKTDLTDPMLDFRVCLECKGGKEFCKDHLKNHTHLEK